MELSNLLDLPNKNLHYRNFKILFLNKLKNTIYMVKKIHALRTNI